MKKKYYICPYCFNKNKISDIEFRCINKRCTGHEEDEVYAKFLGTRPMIKGLAFKPAKSMFKSTLTRAECPECKTQSTKYLCSTCHCELPNNIAECDDLIISIIGAKETGKSHYIAVLIDIIKNKIGKSFNCSLRAINDETIEKYNNDFYNPIYKRRETIKITNSAMTSNDAKLPLVYTLTFQEDKKFSKNKISNVITLVFFDTAGEDLNAQDTMETVNKYIYNSSGIIFLLDPLQIDSVRNRLPVGTNLPQKNTEIEDIIERTINLIRSGKNIQGKNKIDIPVAAAFTKMDALESIIDQSSQLNYSATHLDDGIFDINDCEIITQEIEALIDNWGESSFSQKLKIEFKDSAMFGLTALGCNPHGTNRIDKFRPRRVEDPFLWLLYKNNVIKGKRKK